MTNGLSLKTINSSSTPLTELPNVAHVSETDWQKFLQQENLPKQGYVVAYLDYQVIMGTYEAGQFRLPDNHQVHPRSIQRLRVFNAQEELLLWRSNGSLKGRMRQDGIGKECDIVEACQILSGTKSEVKDDFTLLSEKKGSCLLVPSKFEADTGKKRVAIRTRNYVTFTPAHQATYNDCRFVEFVQMPVRS
jgi:CRISPR-associated protein (TIGR03984 family)